MPLSQPSGGGLGAINGALMATLRIQNTGADIAINFNAMQWDNINRRILIQGNNDYVGTKASVFAKLQQASALPALPNNTGVCIVPNRGTGGAIVMDGAANVFIAPNSLLSSWTDITPPAAISDRGIFTMTGNSRIYVWHPTVGGPDRNLSFSDDQGLTWDEDPGLFTGLTSTANWCRTNRLGTIVGMGGVGDFAVSSDPDTIPWELFSMATAGINQNIAAFSDDGTQMVVCANNGQIATVTGGLTAGNEIDIAVADNFFAQVTNNGLAIDFCEFIPSLNGFLIADISSEAVGFISSDDMTVVQAGVYLGTGPSAVTSFRNGISVVDDAGDSLYVGNTNTGSVFFRFGT